MKDERIAITAFLWLTYLGFLWFMAGSIGAWVIVLAFVAMIPVIVMTVFMWGAEAMMMGSRKHEEQSAEESEKRKRDRLDAVLRELSDADLMRLRERLQDGHINDEVLYDRMVGDDGELIIPDRRD